MRPNRLEQTIRERIASEGPVTFETFMDLALYHPQGGYYMSDGTRIGTGGDYYTAPHLHPILGWLLAVQLDEARQTMGCPDNFTVLEIGAGKGHLAQDIIEYVISEFGWQASWRYAIVEQNPMTEAAQRELLAPYSERVDWKRSLSEVEPFCGCVISNELLDAFPIHLLQMDGQPREIFVDVNDSGFVEIKGDPASEELLAYIERYRVPVHTGYRTEANLRIKDYITQLDHALTEGFVVTIDYGYTAHEYYSPERRQGTLLAYSRHTVNDNPLADVGRQDLTAHVNFTSLRDWGRSLGFRTVGYCSQGAFLASLGIDQLISRQLEKDKTFQGEIPKIKNLLFGMGDTHQVMAQYKGPRDMGKLRGFMLSDRQNRL